ncbi:hypothetical protein [Agrobacterium rosae]|uniref:hypothetical protein n=1 Tax=Agrobacterium rosae TaxID=1972867 RepID=UPI00122F25B2|nr:hypothetical protein [Agrobacterium rosae]KAA3510129.1 hypothetical protein DXM21_20075 [Agrobacterium rosae]KAA3514926.1 hypothetical protein DXM25_20295 [Agrobacterium rosae]MQB50750.1 hypothetical protein [Agrobacterium rosae]
MTAEIITLHRVRPAVRLVFSSVQEPQIQLDRHALCQLANATDLLNAALGEISDANRTLLRGRSVPDGDPIVTGETLELILRAGMQAALFSGASNRDRPIMQAMRDWLKTNGSADHV